MARTASSVSCSEDAKALKEECVMLGRGGRELIMDYA